MGPRLLLLFGVLAAPAARGATPTVCADGGCTFTTITACARAAAPGDVCAVGPGVYHETVDYGTNFALGVTLVCPGRDCVVDGDGVRTYAFRPFRDWTVEGFEIRNTTGDAFGGDTNRELIAVRDCWIHDLGGHAVVRLDDDAVVEGNTIERVFGYGVQCGIRTGVVVRDNVIVSAGIGDATGGVACDNAGTLVTGNVVDLRRTTAPLAGTAPSGIFGATVTGNVVVGGAIALSASASSSNNQVWGWSGSPWGGVAPGPGDATVDVLPDDALPIDEIVASSTTFEAPAMARTHLGPAVARYDRAAGFLAFAVRDGDDAWVTQDVVAATIPNATSLDVREHPVDLGVDPITGRPVVAWLDQVGTATSLRVARFVGDGCGDGCASPDWSGCADTPLATFAGSGTVSLAFDPVDGVPVVALVARSGASCGSAADAVVDLFRLDPDGVVTTVVETGGCTHDLGLGLDVTVSPVTGAAELVWTRAPSGVAAGVLRHAAVTAAGAATVTTIGTGGVSTHDGRFTRVAAAHTATGDLHVVFSSTSAFGSYAFAEVHRVGGVWGAPVVQDAIGGGGVRPIEGLDLAIDAAGHPVAVWTRNGVPRLAWPDDADRGITFLDARRRTGFWASIAALPAGGAVVAWQADSEGRRIRVVAETDPGAAPPGGGLDLDCASDDACVAATCTDDGCLLVDADCDDANACTDDACDAGLGCVHTDNADPCDDGDPDTTGDACTLGACHGTPLPVYLVLSEAIGAGDAVGPVPGRTLWLAEGVAVVEATTPVAGWVLVVGEGIGAADHVAPLASITLWVAEGVGAVDAVAGLPQRLLAVLEALGVRDTPVHVPGATVAVSEGVGVGDLPSAEPVRGCGCQTGDPRGAAWLVLLLLVRRRNPREVR